MFEVLSVTKRLIPTTNLTPAAMSLISTQSEVPSSTNTFYYITSDYGPARATGYLPVEPGEIHEQLCAVTYTAVR